MKPETRFVNSIKDCKPSGAWWYNIPTQAGKAGISLPYDCQAVWMGNFFAFEFKWSTGYQGARPHQLAALADVNHAGGHGLLVCGNSDGSITIWTPGDSSFPRGAPLIVNGVGDFWRSLSHYFIV
jgi:hypothetical protein